MILTDLTARLQNAAKDIREQWENPEGTRTRHFFVDDLLPDETCDSVYKAFPGDADGFFNRESFRERKRTSAGLKAYDPILTEVTYAFQDPAIVDLVSKIIGFDQIEPDPNLYAGGLSMMFRGDFLNPHIDNSHDGERDRYRRLNLLYYVTPDWTLEKGGNFELWDETGKVPKTIVSKRNRLVVMETNKTSLHSVSPVVAEGPRCCVSNYYFSTQSPDGSDYFHVTSFTGRPEQRGLRALAALDNGVRNLISKALKTGRGRHLVND